MEYGCRLPAFGLAVMLIPAAWGLWLVLRGKKIRQPTVLATEQRPAILLAATLALLMSIATVYGVFNNTVDVPRETEPESRGKWWGRDTLTLDHLARKTACDCRRFPTGAQLAILSFTSSDYRRNSMRMGCPSAMSVISAFPFTSAWV